MTARLFTDVVSFLLLRLLTCRFSTSICRMYRLCTAPPHVIHVGEKGRISDAEMGLVRNAEKQFDSRLKLLIRGGGSIQGPVLT